MNWVSQIQPVNQDKIVVEVVDLAPYNKRDVIRVLHVDDDPSIQEISKLILMDMGNFDIDNACCVDEACEKLSTGQYDVVVSDYEMPQKNGLDFLKEIREQKNDVAFIIFTGRGREDVAVKALNLGADRYLDKNGSPEAVYCELAHAINKIAERKKSKKALAQSELNYRRVVEKSLQGILITQTSPLRLVFANESMGNILGYSIEELKSLSPLGIAGLIYNEDKAVFFSRLESRIHGEPSDASLEFRAVRKNGSIVWLEAFASRIEYMEEPAVQGMFLDISARKKSDQVLREKEMRYRELADSLPDIVFEIDLNGKFTFLNQRAFEITGFTREDFEKGLNIFQLANPEEMQKGLENIQRSLDGKSHAPTEYTITRKNGTTFTGLIRASRCISENKVIGLRAIVIDITENKKNDFEIKQKNEALERVSESIGSGLAVIGKDYSVVWANKYLMDLGVAPNKKCYQNFNKSDTICPDCGAKKIFEQNASLAVHEYKTINSKGETVWIELRVTPLKDKDGNVTAALELAVPITERKLMQHALQESEEKFRTITSSVKDAIILVDDEAKVVYWNPAAEKTFGYSNVEAIGKDVHELIVPKTMCKEGRECIKTSVQQFANTGSGAFTNGNVELQGQRRDGTEFSVNISLTPIKLRGKWSVVGVVKDITERKQAEQKLQAAEKRYHALFNEAPLGVLVIDPQSTKPVEFNDVAHIQLGYSREEFSKLCISDFVKDKPDEINAYIAKMLQEGGDEFETKHSTKNGEIRNVLVNTRVVELEGKLFLYCVFHDITEIRKVQEALMESETQYRQLINVAQEGIWALDNKCQTVFVNPQMAKMLGYSESEMVGKNLFEFLDKTCIEKAKQVLGQFKQDAKGHFDCEFTRKNGSRIYVTIAVSEFKDDEGKPSGTLMMVSDITDRKVLEAKVNNYSKHLKSMVELRTTQLKAANEQLVKSERLAAIGELAGMVGHDLRNPLTGIKNATYYLKKKGTTISEVQAKEMLETIDNAIDHSNKIINDLLDYAREIHLELTECAPRKLVDEASQMIQVPDRIQIVNHVLEETKVKVDADKMMRVFINLIKNAVDAMPEKGTLEITSHKTKDNVEISFADTGKGIPDDVLPKLFTPLFTTKAQGMGFGLAICKRIIEVHGGRIKVETAVNKGTTFTITLPVKPKLEVGGEKTWINMPESLLSTTTKT